MTARSTCPHDDDRTTCPPCNRHLRPISNLSHDNTGPVLLAQYTSTCDACGAQVEEGDEIVRAGDVYIHVGCLDPWG